MTLAASALAAATLPARLAVAFTRTTLGLGTLASPDGPLERLLAEDGVVERLLAPDGPLDRLLAPGGALGRSVTPLGDLANRLPGGRRRTTVVPSGS